MGIDIFSNISCPKCSEKNKEAIEWFYKDSKIVQVFKCKNGHKFKKKFDKMYLKKITAKIIIKKLFNKRKIEILIESFENSLANFIEPYKQVSLRTISKNFFSNKYGEFNKIVMGLMKKALSLNEYKFMEYINQVYTTKFYVDYDDEPHTTRTAKYINAHPDGIFSNLIMREYFYPDMDIVDVSYGAYSLFYVNFHNRIREIIEILIKKNKLNGIIRPLFNHELYYFSRSQMRAY